jgi:hypothetical protein
MLGPVRGKEDEDSWSLYPSPAAYFLDGAPSPLKRGWISFGDLSLFAAHCTREIPPLLEVPMNRFRTVAIVVLSVLVVSCGELNSVKGSGNVITENRTVSGFDSVSLNGNGKLEIDQNGTEALSITADDNILPLLTSEIKGTQLVLRVKSGTSISPSKTIVFKVGARNLTAISCAGDTTAVATGIHTDSLKLDIAGSGDMSAEGSSDRQEITIAGSGKYLGGSLKSRIATINIAGSGDAVLAVSDKLDVTIAGSGSIKYLGDPTVKQSVLGSGTITKQ